MLAALAAAAIPGLDVVATRHPRGFDDEVEFTGLLDATGASWLVRAPRSASAGAALEAESALLHVLASVIDREGLPFDVMRPAGFADLPEGGRAVVSRELAGAPLDVFSLTGGPGLAASLGGSLAALHEVDATLAEDVGLPVYDAGECRTRLQAEVDQMAQTSRVPLDLLKRWERALEDVRCWRFRPTFVHGDLQAERVLVEGAEVVAFTGFTASYVGDPAVDLAWLLASAPEDAVESILEAYAFGRVEGGSGLLVERAQLLSEVALGRWLMHGLRHNDPVVTAEAEEMLADLAAAVIDAPEIIES